MPIFHPTAFHPIVPGMALKPMQHRTDPSALAAPAPLPGFIATDTPVAPAAPPSAIQMQIKALISEQALTLEADKQAQSDT
jgi:hypothetical protein